MERRGVPEGAQEHRGPSKRSPESKAVSLRWCNDPSRPYQKLKGGDRARHFGGWGPLARVAYLPDIRKDI